MKSYAIFLSIVLLVSLSCSNVLAGPRHGQHHYHNGGHGNDFGAVAAGILIGATMTAVVQSLSQPQYVYDAPPQLRYIPRQNLNYAPPRYVPRRNGYHAPPRYVPRRNWTSPRHHRSGCRPRW